MKKQSIRHYLFKTVLTTLLVITIFISIINLTVANAFKRDFIFHELDEAIEYGHMVLRIKDNTSHVVTFNIYENNGEYSANNVQGKEKYKIDDGIYSLVAKDYFNDKESENRIYKDHSDYYYQVRENGPNLLVYLVVINKSNYMLEIIGVIALVLVTVYIASLRISKYIADPVEKIRDYSKEIAKKNWSSKLEPIKNKELSDLADDLDKMKIILEKADLEERQFLHATSHDLKTPIMIIKGYAQAMLDGIKLEGTLSAEEVLFTEAERLERKVNQLVNLNSMNYTLENTKTIETVSINRIIHHITEKILNINSSIKIDIEEVAFEINGIADPLRIAFENIIDNQLRYAKSKIKIQITEASILISNDGPHFELDNDEMFEIYKKGTSGNFGLGLAISKKAIEAHKGTIEAYNLEEGVCFKISL